jgi:hypothetical protein
MEKTAGERPIDFSFVYSKCAIQVKDFLDQVPKKAECISYIEVLNKLTRNDYMQEEPSDEVVASYLIKQISSILSKKDVELVYYVLSSKDQETINSVIDYAGAVTHRPIRYAVQDLDGPEIETP